jgi:hypothetical protein
MKPKQRDTTAKPKQPDATAKPKQADTTAKPTQADTTAKPKQPDMTAKPQQRDATAGPTQPDPTEKTAGPTQPDGTAGPTQSDTTGKPTQPDMTKQPDTTAEVPKYEPTETERIALDKQAQRLKEQGALPRLTRVEDYRGIRMEHDHPARVVAHALLKEAVGTADDDFLYGILDLLMGLADLTVSHSEALDGTNDRFNTNLNFLLAGIKGGKPKDEQHAMLLVQSGIIFLVQMRNARNFFLIEQDFLREEEIFFHRLDKASALRNTLALLESAERTYSRFARTSCMLMETSDRHRRGGEPFNAVQQVTVGIVGNITHADPNAAPKNPTAGPRALTDQGDSAMPIIEHREREQDPLRQGRKDKDDERSSE